MKNYIFALFLLMNILPAFSQENSIRLASYNIRFDNPNDIGNLWADRKFLIQDLIQKHKFDIYGAQEAKPNQIQDLINLMPEYDWKGMDKEGTGKDEFCAIFYKKERFDLLNSGHFWLSATPEKPSRGWDAKYKRVCNWVYLEDKLSNRKFYIFNAHFDHRGELAKENSTKIIIEKAKEIAGDNPIILTGDFNFDRTSPNYSILRKSTLLQDAFIVSKIRKSTAGSSQGFKIDANPLSPIDHIFVTSSSINVAKYDILRDSYNRKLPSDHYPVVIDFGFKNQNDSSSKKRKRNK